jgi:hypothetical protein
MSDTIVGMIGWMAAEADDSKFTDGTGFPWQGKSDAMDGSLEKTFSAQDLPVENLPSHQFPATSPLLAKAARSGVPEEGAPTGTAQGLEGELPAEGGQAQQAEQQTEQLRDDDRERRIYRNRTVAMLRRYMRYSIETGRLPSLLGREFFRTQVTSYSVGTFEDRVIFVHDMEKCLDRLDEFSRDVLGRVVLQEYDHEATARLLGCTRMTVHRRLLEALDLLSSILLELGLLDHVSSVEENLVKRGQRAIVL